MFDVKQKHNAMGWKEGNRTENEISTDTKWSDKIVAPMTFTDIRSVGSYEHEIRWILDDKKEKDI